MGNGQRIRLLDNVTGAGNGSAKRWDGGKGSFIIQGTFGGTTAELQFQTPEGVWIAVSSATSTIGANAHAEFEIPKGQLRAVLTGGTPSVMFADAVRE